jgi:hypothetical protein
MGIFSRAVMAFIVMLGLSVTLSMGQTSAPKAATATASKSSIVIIDDQVESDQAKLF